MADITDVTGDEVYDPALSYDAQIAELERRQQAELDALGPTGQTTPADYGSTGTTSVPIDPGIGTGATYDFSSIFNTGAQVAGDVAKTAINTSANKAGSTPANPPAAPPAAAPPTALIPAPGAALAPAMSSGTKTALIVGGSVLGVGLLTVIAIAATGRRRRRSI
jgi:hypothetical protein